MRVASMTECFANAAARGLMRKSVGVAGAGRGATGASRFGVRQSSGAFAPADAVSKAAEGCRSPRPGGGSDTFGDGETSFILGAAGAGAVTAGIGSPGLPRKPTVLWTGT